MQADYYFQISLFITSVALSWNKLYQIPFGLRRVLLLTSLWSTPEMRVSSTTDTQEVTDILRLFPTAFPRATGLDAFSMTDAWLFLQKEQSLHPAYTFSEECKGMYTNIITYRLKVPYQLTAHLVNYLGLFGGLQLLWGKNQIILLIFM